MVRQRVALSAVGVLLLFGVSTGVAGAQACTLGGVDQAQIVETARFFGVDLSIAEAIFCGQLAAASPPVGGGGGGGTPTTTIAPGVTTTTTRPTTTTTVRPSTTTTAPFSPTTTVAAAFTRQAVPAPKGALSSVLARTGGDILAMLVASGALMVVGLVLVARTRRSQAVKAED